jgi:hypothetical protein
MSLGNSVQLAWLGVALVSAAVVGCAVTEPPAPDAAAQAGWQTDAPTADDASEAAVSPHVPASADAAALPPSPADAGAPASAAGCQTDDDCQLVRDCCSCQAIPRGEKPAACDPNRSCVISLCAQYQGGVDRARCSAGLCVLGFDCDTTTIVCKRLPPICPPGQAPQVVGGCFGECVDARQCRAVPACTACRLTDRCVRSAVSPTTLHCQDAPRTALREM